MAFRESRTHLQTRLLYTALSCASRPPALLQDEHGLSVFREEAKIDPHLVPRSVDSRLFRKLGLPSATTRQSQTLLMANAVYPMPGSEGSLRLPPRDLFQIRVGRYRRIRSGAIAN